MSTGTIQGAGVGEREPERARVSKATPDQVFAFDGRQDGRGHGRLRCNSRQFDKGAVAVAGADPRGSDLRGEAKNARNSHTEVFVLIVSPDNDEIGGETRRFVSLLTISNLSRLSLQRCVVI